FEVDGAAGGRLGAGAVLDHAVLHAARQGLDAGLRLVLGQERVALGLVLGGGLLVRSLGLFHLGLLALLHGLHGRAHLFFGDRRLLLGITVLHRLVHGGQVDLLAAVYEVAAELVAEVVTDLA